MYVYYNSHNNLSNNVGSGGSISDFLLHQVKSSSHLESLPSFATTRYNPFTAVSLELALTIINNFINWISNDANKLCAVEINFLS